MRTQFNTLTEALSTLSAADGLRWISEKFPGTVKLSTALGKEAQVLTHIIATENIPVSIFTVDTGRLFQETYDLHSLTQKKYGINIKVYFPDSEDVQSMVNEKGMNCFYDSPENRKECCSVRKILPFKKGLEGASVWITGLRAEHSAYRKELPIVEWDENYQVIKYNPLLHWTAEALEQFIVQNNVPVNALHKKGFPSIGCTPCTQAVQPGQDERSGRWWWETSNKECGLHQRHAEPKLVKVS